MPPGSHCRTVTPSPCTSSPLTLLGVDSCVDTCFTTRDGHCTFGYCTFSDSCQLLLVLDQLLSCGPESLKSAWCPNSCMRGSCWISGFQLINCSKSRLVKVMNVCPVESVIVNFGTRVLPSLLRKFDTYTFRPEQPKTLARNCFSAIGARRHQQHQIRYKVLWTTGIALGIR